MSNEIDKLTESISQLTIREKTIVDLLKEINEHPELLKKKNPTLSNYLQQQGDSTSQGTGNKVTDQEGCFAELLEAFGYKFIPKTSPSVDENYYRYQPRGTQRNIDFEVFDKKLNKIFKFDLKHTNSKSFYLNDGWFEDGVIYVINWSPKKDNNKVLIGYGEDIPTEEEKQDMKEFIKFKKDSNKFLKKVGSLRKYLRFANQYSCQTFTETFSTEKFNLALKKVT